MTSRVDGPRRPARLTAMAAAAAGLLFAGALAAASPYDQVPVPNNWKAFEVTDRVRFRMPGKPKLWAETDGALRIASYSLESDRGASYGVLWLEGDALAHLRGVAAETMLVTACDGMLARVKDLKELSRASIKLRGIPGKNLVLDSPERRLSAVARVYFNERSGRLYLAAVFGEGIREDSSETVWFFKSFDIREAGPDRGAPAPGK